MKKVVYFGLTAVMLFVCCTGNKKQNIATSPVNLSEIKPIKKYEFASKMADFIGINKYGTICIRNSEYIDMPMPHVYCFKDDGSQIYIGSCYATIPDDISDLLNGKEQKMALLDKTHTIYEFLTEINLQYLNGLNITPENLPKSDYYLFIDWYWLMDEQIQKAILKIDNVLIHNKSKVKIQYFKYHATNSLEAKIDPNKSKVIKSDTTIKETIIKF